MTSPKHNSRLDGIGMTASVLCAIHCAVVPLILTTLPLIGLGFLANPLVEWSMIILALILGVTSIFFSYFRTHKRILPLLLLLLGFAIIICGHIFITGWVESIVVPIGGFTIAIAHFVNFKYVGACDTAGPHILHLKHPHHERH
jgi:hypothetical protein